MALKIKIKIILILLLYIITMALKTLYYMHVSLTEGNEFNASC